MNAGILGFGIYVPKYRIKVSDIASVWGKKGEEVEKILGLREKSLGAYDEDAVTMAYEAAIRSIKTAECKPSDIEVVFVGSESHPYAVNPTSTIVAEFLGVGRNYLAADLEFACKAATAGMVSVIGMISSGMASYGLVIGSDMAQAKPHDILEYTASSGACAFILGKKNQGCMAEILATTSYTSDTPDFWRRDGVRFPSHGGRFTGEPAYFTHVMGAAKNLLNNLKMKPADFDYCVFHMPNAKFPREVAKRLGFTEQQLLPSLIVDYIGNPYSASSLLGLAAVLDIAKPDQLIFMVSYGSGAGSDGLVLRTTETLQKKRKQAPSFKEMMASKKYISYVDYLKFRGKI